MNCLAKILFSVLFLLLMSIGIEVGTDVGTEAAFATISRPLADQGPTQVIVFLHILDLDEIFNES